MFRSTTAVLLALFAGCQSPNRIQPVARASDIAFCARGSAGVECATWDGSGFGASQLWTGAFADDDGWGSSPAYWGTLRRPELDGDRADDLCARGPHGLICARRQPTRFGAVIESAPE